MSKPRPLLRAFLAASISGALLGFIYVPFLSPLLPDSLRFLPVLLLAGLAVPAGPLFHLFRRVGPRPARGALAAGLYWAALAALLIDPLSAPFVGLTGALSGAPAGMVLRR